MSANLMTLYYSKQCHNEETLMKNTPNMNRGHVLIFSLLEFICVHAFKATPTFTVERS